MSDFEVLTTRQIAARREQEEARATLRRIEHKLDTLIAALAEEGDEPALRTLDGQTIAARDTSKGLG